jgi:hypothetical protein
LREASHHLHNGGMRKVIALLFILAAFPLFASDFDKLVTGVVDAYGGEAAWKGVHAIRQTGSVMTMTGKQGKMTRTWDHARKLHVEIVYPDRTEDRNLDGAKGTNNGKDVTGMQLDAMTMQWGRLAIPALLTEQRAHLHDLGEKDGLHLIEIPLSETLTITATVDPKTFHVVHSASKGTAMGQTVEFGTEYSDFRKADGLLFAFTEENSAQGMKTATSTLTEVHVDR